MLFIVFEGIDGSGKSTMLERSRIWLSPLLKIYGFSGITVTHEPGVTGYGQLVKAALMTHDLCPTAELLAFASDRAQHVHEVIKPAISAGNLVLCDRFTDSTIAYQGYGRKLDLWRVRKACQFATDLEPDLVIWLDCPVDVAMARAKGGDRFDAEDARFFERVRKGYEMSLLGRRGVKVDASGSEDEVWVQVQTALQLVLKERSGS